MTGIGHDACAGPAKKSKPAMEKRRRARINASLLELRDLIPETKQRLNKMEKADILEMTVKHLKRLQETNKSLEKNTPSSRSYSLGFNECTQEVSEFFRSSSPLTTEVKHNLLNHLSKCAPHNPPDSPSSSPAKATTAATTTMSELQVTTSAVTTSTLRNASIADSILSRCLLSTFPTTSSSIVKSRVSSPPRCNVLTSERNNVSTPIAVSSTSDDGPGENTDRDNSDERSITPLNFTCVKIPPHVKSDFIQNKSALLSENVAVPSTSNANTVKRDLLSAFQWDNNNNVPTTHSFNDANNNMSYDESSLKNMFAINKGNKIFTGIVSDRNCHMPDTQHCPDLNPTCDSLTSCTTDPQPPTSNNSPTGSKLATFETATEDTELKANQNFVLDNERSYISVGSDQHPSNGQPESTMCVDNYANHNTNYPSQPGIFVSKLSLLCKTENGRTQLLVDPGHDALSNSNHLPYDRGHEESRDTQNRLCVLSNGERIKHINKMATGRNLKNQSEFTTVSDVDLERKSESAPAYLIPIYVQTEENQNVPLHHQTVVVSQTPGVTPTSQAMISDIRQHEGTSFNDTNYQPRCQLKSPMDVQKDNGIIQPRLFEDDSTITCIPSGIDIRRTNLSKNSPAESQSTVSVIENKNIEMIHSSRTDDKYQMQTPHHNLYQNNRECIEDELTPPDHTTLSYLRVRKIPLALRGEDEGSSCCNSDDECHESGHSTSDSARNSNEMRGWVWGYNFYDSDEDDESLSGPTLAKRSKQCLHEAASKLKEEAGGVRSRKNSFAKRLGDFRLRKGSLSRKLNFSRPPKCTFPDENQREHFKDNPRVINVDDDPRPDQFRRRCSTYSQKPSRPWACKMTLNSEHCNSDIPTTWGQFEHDRKRIHAISKNSEDVDTSKSFESNDREFLTARRRCATVSAQDLRGKRPLFVKKIQKAPENDELIREEDDRKCLPAWGDSLPGLCIDSVKESNNDTDDYDYGRFRKRCSTFTSPRARCFSRQTKTGLSSQSTNVGRYDPASSTRIHCQSDMNVNEADADRGHFLVKKEAMDAPCKNSLAFATCFKSRSLYDISEKDRQIMPESPNDLSPFNSGTPFRSFGESTSSSSKPQSCLTLSNSAIACAESIPLAPGTRSEHRRDTSDPSPYFGQDKSKSCQNAPILFHRSTTQNNINLTGIEHLSSSPLNLSTKSRRYSTRADDGSSNKKMMLPCLFNSNPWIDQNEVHRPRSWSVSSGMSSLSLGGSKTNLPPTDDDENVWRPW